MEFVLQIDERVVVCNVEIDVTQDATHDTRADICGLSLDDDFSHRGSRGLDLETGKSLQTQVDFEGSGDAFNAEQVVPVSSNLNLVDVLFGEVHVVASAIDAGHLHLVSGAVFQLHAEFEAQILEVVVV